MSDAMTEVESLARHLAVAAGLDPDTRVSVHVPYEVRLPGHVGRLLDVEMMSSRPAWHFYRSMAEAALEWNRDGSVPVAPGGRDE